MSKIIVFTVKHIADVAKPSEIDILDKESIEDIRDKIQHISNFLIAFHKELAKVMTISVGLSETKNTSLPIE